MKVADIARTLIVMVLWGFHFGITKLGLEQIPPIAMMALRFALVAAILLPFVAVPRGHWRRIAMLSMTLGSLHFSLMFLGLAGLDAGTAAITAQIQVPFAAILAAIFHGDRLGWRRSIGMVIAFAGISLVAGEPRVTVNLVPLLMVIGASLMWAIANLQIKDLVGVDGFALTGYVSLLSVPQLIVLSALLERGQLAAIASADWVAWAAVINMAVFVTVIAYGMWYRLLRRYTINQTVPFMLLVPVFGVLSGIVLRDEPLTWHVIVGGAATIVGVALTVRRQPLLDGAAANAKSG